MENDRIAERFAVFLFVVFSHNFYALHLISLNPFFYEGGQL